MLDNDAFFIASLLELAMWNIRQNQRTSKRNEDQIMPPLTTAPHNDEFEQLTYDVMTKFEVNRELVLSTSHVTEAECNDNPFINYSSDEHNARFHVKNTLGEIRDYSQYSNLNRLLELAKWLNCKWLLLDEAGDVHTELKVFEW